MKTTQEIASKFSNAVGNLINNHSREIERIRDENDGKVNLRFSCLLTKDTSRLSFGVATKDEITEKLDGDQLPSAGLETPPLKIRRQKRSA
jgi:hypothetical protein